MEPDFISEQVKNVWRVIAANAKVIADKKLTIEGAFVRPDFVLRQAAALHYAVLDSVNIQRNLQLTNKDGGHQPFVIMKPEFLSQQGKALQVVIDDSARLQDANKTTHSELTSLGDMFVMGLISNLRDVVSDNAKRALEANMQPNLLHTSRPEFAADVISLYHCAMAAYISQKRSVDVLQSERLATERALLDFKAQVDASIVEKSEALSKVAVLEASVAALVQERDELSAHTKDAENAAQGRIHKLEEELSRLSSEHLRSGSMAEENGTELVALKEERKALMQRCEEQRDAAALAVRQVLVLTEERQQLQLDRDRLAVELTDTRASSESFSLDRAREHDQMNATIARLEDTLKKRDAVMSSLAEEKAQLKMALDSVKADLQATSTQLSATVIQSDTWKATLDDVVSRQTADIESIRQDAAKEKESADVLLGNAVKKIEELELRLLQKDTEISTLREAAKQPVQRPAFAPPVKLPASPPPSSRKRPLPADDNKKRSAAGSTSAGGSWDLDLATHGSPLPLGRIQELATLPEVVVDLGPGQVAPAIFTRQSLSSILGGSIQGLVVRCTESASDLARERGIQDYLCPNMDHNAWSPAGPGKHGYMQVGLGRDKRLFNDAGDYRHVFVGAGKYFLYCGWYHVLRVDPLTKEEWETLPPKVKHTYSETTVSKEKSSELKSAQQVLRMYNEGVLRAPCVRLQCVEFDTAFYQELARANDQYFQHKPLKMRPSAHKDGAGPSKRRRVAKEGTQIQVDDSSEEEVSLALVTGKKTLLATPSSTHVSSSTTQLKADETAVAKVDLTTPEPPSFVPPTDVNTAPMAGPSTKRAAPSIKLRIPPRGRINGRPSLPDVLDDVIELSDLSSESDDDDMYAD